MLVSLLVVSRVVTHNTGKFRFPTLQQLRQSKSQHGIMRGCKAVARSTWILLLYLSIISLVQPRYNSNTLPRDDVYVRLILLVVYPLVYSTRHVLSGSDTAPRQQCSSILSRPFPILPPSPPASRAAAILVRDRRCRTAATIITDLRCTQGRPCLYFVDVRFTRSSDCSDDIKTVYSPGRGEESRRGQRQHCPRLGHLHVVLWEKAEGGVIMSGAWPRASVLAAVWETSAIIRNVLPSTLNNIAAVDHAHIKKYFWWSTERKFEWRFQMCLRIWRNTPNGEDRPPPNHIDLFAS